MFVHSRTANAAAVRDLADALRELGIHSDIERSEGGPDLIVRSDDGRTVHLEVKARAAPSHADVSALPDPPAGRSVVPVLVANRIAEVDRRELARRGWGFLDRRGVLRVWGPGLRIQHEVRPRVQSAERAPSPFTPIGRALALNLLARASRYDSMPSNLRDYATKELHASPSRVSELMHALQRRALVDDEGEPMMPDLFWALSEHWRPTRLPLATEPDLRSRRDADLEVHQWIRAGESAAAVWGAPIVFAADPVPDVYVTDETTVHIATLRLGRAPDRRGAAMTIAVPPARLTDTWIENTVDQYLLAEPVVVALDLAIDARGREAVEAWREPGDGYRRVW